MYLKDSYDCVKFIYKLAKLEGGKLDHGECFCGASFKLANGKILQFGLCDDDVAGELGITVRQY